MIPKKNRLYTNTEYGYVFVRNVDSKALIIEIISEGDPDRLYHLMNRKRLNWKEIKQIRL